MRQAATSLGRNGLQDWIIQRVSAIILAFYFLWFAGFWMFYVPIDYTKWRSLFENPWIKIFHVCVLVSLLAHAWVGVWTISTDYIKYSSLRLTIQMITAIILCVIFAWGVVILWRV